MPHQTRRTIAVVAVLVIVVVAVVLIVLRAGRDKAQPQPSASSMSTSTSTSVPTPTYTPTDAYGSPEPGLAKGAAEAGSGGRAVGPEGLPLGYTQSPAGAASAAANYLAWMNSLRIVDKSAADAMAGAAAGNPQTERALIKSFDVLRSGMTDLTSDEEQVTRGAYALRSYSPQRAVVYVWAPEVTTSRDGRTDHVWSIDAVQLVWASGDWKLDGALIARSGAAAVDPADPAGSPSPAEKHAILSRTPADPGDITDSADQTWFEFANAAH